MRVPAHPLTFKGYACCAGIVMAVSILILAIERGWGLTPAILEALGAQSR